MSAWVVDKLSKVRVAKLLNRLNIRLSRIVKFLSKADLTHHKAYCKSSLRRIWKDILHEKFLSGGHSDVAPPDPIPNSEVKHVSGDGSVGFPHVRVAHRQTPIRNEKAHSVEWAFFV